MAEPNATVVELSARFAATLDQMLQTDASVAAIIDAMDASLGILIGEFVRPDHLSTALEISRRRVSHFARKRLSERFPGAQVQ